MNTTNVYAAQLSSGDVIQIGNTHLTATISKIELIGDDYVATFADGAVETLSDDATFRLVVEA